VIDAASMKKFGEASNPIVKAHGGQFVARRSNITSVIGDAPKSVTVIMFESVEKAKDYFQSAEYKAILPLPGECRVLGYFPPADRVRS
jgi:uncharacterized protein (DUF1330 family)